MSRVLVLAEHRRGLLREVSLEALTAAREIPNARCTTVILGSGTAKLAEELARYAEQVFHIDDASLEQYDPIAWTEVLTHLVAREAADAVVLPHSCHGMDLAGRLAAALDRSLATDLIELSDDAGRIVVRRSVHGGRVEARIALPAGEPFVLSVRPTAFPAAEPIATPGAVETIERPPAASKLALDFLGYLEQAADDVDISQAEIVVGVGRGIGERENLELITELAEALGGVVACSRPIVDRGWMPRNRQVGISGRTVRPKIYLALGISGAFQHVTGMKGAGRIIAVNRDPRAPIFEAADYGIVGDLFEIVPHLRDTVRQRRRNGGH